MRGEPGSAALLTLWLLTQFMLHLLHKALMLAEGMPRL